MKRDTVIPADPEWTSLEPGRLAEAVIDRARRWARDLLDPNRYEVRSVPELEWDRAYGRWSANRAWLEWWLGVPPPSQQLVSLPDDMLAVRVALSHQIRRQVENQRLLSREARQYGGTPRFEHHNPDPIVAGVLQPTKTTDVGELAAAVQCTERVWLAEAAQFRSIVGVLFGERGRFAVAEQLAAGIDTFITAGRDIVQYVAEDAEKRARLLKVQEAMMSALQDYTEHELAGFGATRRG